MAAETTRPPDPTVFGSPAEAYRAGYSQAIADLLAFAADHRPNLALRATINALIERMRAKRRSL